MGRSGGELRPFVALSQQMAGGHEDGGGAGGGGGRDSRKRAPSKRTRKVDPSDMDPDGADAGGGSGSKKQAPSQRTRKGQPGGDMAPELPLQKPPKREKLQGQPDDVALEAPLPKPRKKRDPAKVRDVRERGSLAGSWLPCHTLILRLHTPRKHREGEARLLQ